MLLIIIFQWTTRVANMDCGIVAVADASEHMRAFFFTLKHGSQKIVAAHSFQVPGDLKLN
jgi:hypothetical protein